MLPLEIGFASGLIANVVMLFWPLVNPVLRVASTVVNVTSVSQMIPLLVPFAEMDGVVPRPPNLLLVTKFGDG